MSTGELIEMRNIQGLWHLENVNDSSINAYNLTNNNAVTFPLGKFVSAASFNGTTQSLSILDASCPNLEIAGSQTWMTWVKPASIAAGEKQIMCKGPSSGTKNLSLNGANPLFRLLGLTSNDNVTSSVALTVGQWAHLAGVYDSVAGVINIWVNGIKDSLPATGSASDTNDIFTLGVRGSAADQFYSGFIDETAIYSRAWKDKEIKDYYAWARGLRSFIA